MSGIDEQRKDHILPASFIREKSWYCKGKDKELSYYSLCDKHWNALGRIFRPSLFYDDKSEEHLVEFFNGFDWDDIVSIRCPTCGIRAWGRESSDWKRFTEYVVFIKQHNLIKYGSEFLVGN